MVQTLETIRLLTIKSIFDGKGLDEARRATEAMTRSVDEAANKVLSNSAQWTKHQKATDDVAKTLLLVADRAKVVRAAYEQGRMGIIGSTEAQARLNEELNKTYRLLDRAGISRNAFDLVQKGTVEEFNKIRTMAMEVNRQRQLEADLSQQVAGFDKKRLSERATLESAINEMRQKAMPLEAQRLLLEKQHSQIIKARQTDLIGETEKVALLADLERRRGIAAQAQKRHELGNRLNRADMTNMGYQLNDIVTMLASGSSPLQVMATQGPQIFQILGQGEKGIVGSLKAMGAYLSSLMTPAKVVMGTLAVGAIAAYTAWSRFDGMVRNVERSLLGAGRATKASAGGLMGIAEKAAEQPGLSISESMGVVSKMASSGLIDPKVMGDTGKMAKDLAVVMGTDLAEASSFLAKALADPTKGIEDLDEQFNIFSETELKAARRMAATGDLFGAQAKIMEGLKKSVGGATETLSGFEQMTNRIGEVASDAFTLFGKDVAKLFGFQTLEEQLKELEALRKRAQENRDFVANDPDVREDRRAGQVSRYDQQLGDIERRAAAVRAEIERLAGGGLQARADRMGKQIIDMAKDWEPFEQRLKAVNQQLELLRGRLGSEEWGAMSEEARKKLHDGIGAAEATQKRMLEQRKYGGEEGYNAVRDSTFTMDMSVLTEFGRAWSEIQRATEKRIEALGEEFKRTEEGKRLIDALNQARDNELEILSRREGMALMNRYAPEVLERSNLANDVDNFTRLRKSLEAFGLSAAEIDAAMGRAQRALANFRTPFQQLTDEYESNVRSLTAYTFQQQELATAEDALAEARRRNLDATETAALKEMRLNELRLRNQQRQYEDYRGARDEAGLVGLKPYQRDQQQLTNEFNNRRETEGDSDYLRQAEAIRRWALEQEALRGPLEESNESLNEQIRLTRIQAQTYGQSAGAIEEAAERQRLLNEYMRAGVQITPELSNAIDAYAQRAGQLAQTRFEIREQQQAFEDLKDMGKDALKGFLADLKEGKSLGEAFMGVLQRLVDRMLDMMIDSLFDPNKPNPFFQLLGALGGNKGQGIGGPATRSTPFGGGLGMALPAAPQSLTGPALAPPSASAYGFNSGGYGGDPYAGVASMVPTFKQATAAVTSFGQQAAKGGNLLTGFGNGLSASNDAFFNYVRKFEGTSGDAGFNTSLAHGKYLPGGKELPLTSMSLGEIDKLQTFMLNNPLNPRNADGLRSSALGVGQFTRTTTRGLKSELGLSDDMIFNEDMQRMLFDRLAIRRGPNATGLGQEWEGIKGHDPATLKGLWNQSYGPGSTRMAGMQGGSGMDPLIQNVDQATTSFGNLNPNLSAVQTNMQGMSQTLSTSVPQMQQSFNQVPSMIGQGSQQMGQAFQQTSGTILQGGTGLGQTFAQIAQSFNTMGGGGGGGIGGLFSGLFGGGGGGGGGWSMAPIGGWGQFDGMWAHTGGRVGGGGGSFRPLSLMDQIAFMSAPRMHSGGKVGGLRHDERRAILQTDEEVLSRKDAADYRKGRGRGGQGGDNKPVVNVNVHNNAGADVETRQNNDGSIDVMVERAEGKMAERAARGRGPLVKTMGREPNSLIG